MDIIDRDRVVVCDRAADVVAVDRVHADGRSDSEVLIRSGGGGRGGHRCHNEVVITGRGWKIRRVWRLLSAMGHDGQSGVPAGGLGPDQHIPRLVEVEGHLHQRDVLLIGVLYLGNQVQHLRRAQILGPAVRGEDRNVGADGGRRHGYAGECRGEQKKRAGHDR